MFFYFCVIVFSTIIINMEIKFPKYPYIVEILLMGVIKISAYYCIIVAACLIGTRIISWKL